MEIFWKGDRGIRTLFILEKIANLKSLVDQKHSFFVWWYLVIRHNAMTNLVIFLSSVLQVLTRKETVIFRYKGDNTLWKYYAFWVAQYYYSNSFSLLWYGHCDKHLIPKWIQYYEGMDVVILITYFLIHILPPHDF